MALCFMFITGFSASRSRAGLVAGLSLAAWYYGRKVHPFVLLPVAAAITVLANPAYAWGDLGWCLSLAAFAGIVVLAPLLQAYFWGRDPPGAAGQLLVETVAASLATLPIILCALGKFPTYALVANMAVLPLVPLAMLLTFGAGAVALAFPGVAGAAGGLAYLILRYMTWVVEQIANLPGAQASLNFNAAELLLAYLILSMLSVYMWHCTGFKFRTEES
jgi:competence protein ComEC